jgi:hypothetical protein
MRSEIVIGLVALCVGMSASAQEATYREEPSEGFLRSWLLCGPFPLGQVPAMDLPTTHLPGFDSDFLSDVGGESGVSPKAGDLVRVGDESLTWSLHESSDDIIDLDEALSKRAAVTGYAYATINAERDEACVLAVGSNDGVRVWVNGAQLYDRWEPGALSVDAHLIPMVLRKGENSILLKVEERGGTWQFCVRLYPLDSDRLAFEDLSMFEIAHQDNKPFLRLAQGRHLPEGTLTRANVAVYAASDENRPIWESAWDGESELRLPVNTMQYGRYTLELDATFAGGTSASYVQPFDAGEYIEHTVIADGKSAYSILLDGTASESERWAAEELQANLAACTGATLPIVDIRGDGPVFAVGYEAARTVGYDAQKPAAEDEAYTYQNIGANIVIVGGSERGAMYGVFSFLEREFGCRWYTPAVTHQPKRARYTFDALWHGESPGVRVRNTFYFEAFKPVWAAHNRVNGAMGTRDQIGGVEGYWAVHTFYRFMPPEEFFDANPEYYSLIDGERVHDDAQLCLTNSDVLDIVTERLRQAMRDNPGNLIYSVSQNDWRNPCQCGPCAAIVAREQSESGIMVWFVNQVAERVEDEFPDKYVGTLAYQYTRSAPKQIRPRDNVVIRLCSIECDFSHDLKTGPANQSFMADLKAWAEVAPHMYIWDYVVNFGHYIAPFPNFGVLKSNIQTLRDHNAIGIMEQAAYQSRGGEFAELRAYLISKLLWNPEADDQAIIDDFMYGYYGRSGQYVREYLDLLHKRPTADTRLTIFQKPEPPLFSEGFVTEAEALFDKAEAVADSDEIRQRVELARLPVMYVKCLLTPLQAKRDGTYARLQAVTERENITHYAERAVEHKAAFEKFMAGSN